MGKIIINGLVILAIAVCAIAPLLIARLIAKRNKNSVLASNNLHQWSNTRVTFAGIAHVLTTVTTLGAMYLICLSEPLPVWTLKLMAITLYIATVVILTLFRLEIETYSYYRRNVTLDHHPSLQTARETVRIVIVAIAVLIAIVGSFGIAILDWRTM